MFKGLLKVMSVYRLVFLMICYFTFAYDRCVIVLVIRLLLLVLIFLRLVFLRLVYEVLLVSCLCDLFPALRAVRSVLSWIDLVYEVLDDNEVFDGVVLGDSVFCSRVSSCYSSSSSSLNRCVICKVFVSWKVLRWIHALASGVMWSLWVLWLLFSVWARYVDAMCVWCTCIFIIKVECIRSP